MTLVPDVPRPDPQGNERLAKLLTDARPDEEKTGRIRCIGCGRFVARRLRWNQCPDCDTRAAEEMGRYG